MERDRCALRPGIRSVIKTLDGRGILHSIASRNDQDLALGRLRRFGLLDYFIHPQIQWGSKVTSLRRIGKSLRIALGSIGFIEDEPYEIAQVRQMLPQVRTYPASEYKSLIDRPEFSPPYLTRESQGRRQTYLKEQIRSRAQEDSGSTFQEFLMSCQTEVLFRPAGRSDLPRILELLHRTHQLNATGEVWDKQKVGHALADPRRRVFVGEIKDRFLDYGRVGVAICRSYPARWRLESFLLSCRVLGRGIGSVFLDWLQHRAQEEGARVFEARYRRRERNRRMYMLFRLTGFEVKKGGRNGSFLLVKKCTDSTRVPDWLTLREDGFS
jgi:FkbH-like protein